ncbi:MAG TPA: hypothetical protein H9770_00800 [Candidatus Fournierella excrementigallinarum]|nr:hypothetical protein [Candidatus Fournierella excrementigallinarum]
MKPLLKKCCLFLLCALLAACGSSSGTDGTRSVDWDSLPEHPPFDYFTVCYYGAMESRVWSEENEIDYFLADELYFLTHRGYSSQNSWSHGDDDWTLFQNVSDLKADQPVFKAALETPDPTEDLQREWVENETPWVKFVWSENRRVSSDGEVYALTDVLEPGDTVQTIRYIAVFLESPEEEGRLDYVTFQQNPATGEYLSWDAHTDGELGVWFRQELALYSWYEIL